MSNLLKYCGACVKQAVYPVNYLIAWIGFYPDFDEAEKEIKPKGFRDFLNGASLRVEYRVDTPELMRKISVSRLEK